MQYISWGSSSFLACNFKARFPLAELKGRVDGPSTRLVEKWARKHGPCWWVMETGHPSTWAVNSGSGNRALVFSCTASGMMFETLTLDTLCLTPIHHVLLRQEKGQRQGKGWRLLAQRFCGRMSFLPSTSAKDIHWNSSFLQLPTDSRGKGNRSILCLLSIFSSCIRHK